jgi:hypothetical protein
VSLDDGIFLGHAFESPPSAGGKPEPELNLTREQERVLDLALAKANAISTDTHGDRKGAVVAALLPFIMQAHIENTRNDRLKQEAERHRQQLAQMYPPPQQIFTYGGPADLRTSF